MTLPQDQADGARPARGLAGDVHRIKAGTAATAAELQEFISQFRGKSPQQVLGVISGSSLVVATIQAALATTVLMIAFTALPYGWKKLYPPPPKVAKVSTPAAAPANPAAASPAQSATAAPGTPAAALPTGPQVANPSEPSAADKRAAIEKMGMGETKGTDPKRNPLENSADDLLKDLK